MNPSCDLTQLKAPQSRFRWAVSDSTLLFILTIVVVETFGLILFSALELSTNLTEICKAGDRQCEGRIEP